MLLGSSLLSPVFKHSRTKVEYTLGDIVRAAFKESGLTDEKWNAMPPLEREHKLVCAAYILLEIRP